MKPAAEIKTRPGLDPSPGPLTIISLGSNLGDPARNVLRAMDRLQDLSGTPLLRSSLWATAPVDCPPGSPDFVNAVVVLRTAPGETPESLLEKLLGIEREFGRAPKKVLNEARPLDLDLIAFGDQQRQTTRLTLPHPRARTRRFVLEPLSELLPDFILPGETKTVTQLLAELPPAPTVRRIA